MAVKSSFESASIETKSSPSISDSEALIFDVTNRSTTELNRIDIAVSEQERRLITFLGGILGNGAKKIT